MAGSYPDPPDTKLQYDLFDVSGYIADADGQATELLSTIELAALNDFALTNVKEVDTGLTGYLGIIFPRAITLVALFGIIELDFQVVGNMAVIGPTEYSTDTTNGQDGSWTELLPSSAADTATWAVNGWESWEATPMDVEPYNRDDIHILAAPVSGIRGLRTRAQGSNTRFIRFNLLHLYGHEDAPEFLEFWHPTLDERLPGSYLDFGDVAQSSSESRHVRIKNHSTTKSAQAVTLSMDIAAPVDTPPQDWFEFSVDGGATYQAVSALGSLPPGGVSSTIIIRRTTPADAQLDLSEIRFVASARGFI